MSTNTAISNPYLRQKKNRLRRNAVVRHGVIIFFLLTILLPLTWVLMLSVKSLPDSMRGNLWPRRFDFTHYAYVFDKIETLPYDLFNSIYVTAATVLITFESDWEAAKSLLTDIAAEHAAPLSASAAAEVRHAAEKYMIFYRNLTPTVYTTVKDCGVLLTIRYLCNARQRRGTEQTIWEAILRAFNARSDVDFAYPTQRFFDSAREGKSVPRPD